MAKPRFTPPSTPTAHEDATRMGFTGGNGSPKVETNLEHLARIETLLEHLQESVDAQFKRIANMQAEIDGMNAERRLSSASAQMTTTPAPTSPLYCPHCRSHAVTVLSIGDDYRTVRVKCSHCHKEAGLMVPPVQS